MKKVLLSVLCIAISLFAGSFKDKRDGQVYKTVKIGNQVWMAQNLNYAIDNGFGSWCYDNEYKHCKKYGRLYTYRTAMNACPAGWHLPSNSEWQELIDYAGGEMGASTALRSKKFEGNDVYGFNILLGGSYEVLDWDKKENKFEFLSEWTVFLTSSQSNYTFSRLIPRVMTGGRGTMGASVRCLKDY